MLFVLYFAIYAIFYYQKCYCLFQCGLLFLLDICYCFLMEKKMFDIYRGNSTKDRTLELPLMRLLDALIIMAIIFLLLWIPKAAAQELTQPPAEESNQTQSPTVQANPIPETEKVMTQALEAQLSQNSVDFLMESKPLSNDPSDASEEGAFPKKTEAETTGALPAELPDLKIPDPENSEDVAMLVSEQCSQNGTSGDGANSCERAYSNGHSATVVTQNANEGDEVKSQTVVEEFDETHTLIYRKTIRHRVDYHYFKAQKSKEKEFFDIIYQPAGKKTTRELMIYEYFLDTGKTRSLAWTQYKQIGNEPKAGLTYNALLRYSQDGKPERGLAEKWNHGKKTATFINWNRNARSFASLNQEAWGQWEGWIQNVSMQAYLP